MTTLEGTTMTTDLRFRCATCGTSADISAAHFAHEPDCLRSDGYPCRCDLPAQCGSCCPDCNVDGWWPTGHLPPAAPTPGAPTSVAPGVGGGVFAGCLSALVLYVIVGLLAWAAVVIV